VLSRSRGAGPRKDGTLLCFARKHDCDAGVLKLKRRPNAPARKIACSVHEAARDRARAIAKTEAYVVSRRARKKVEMLFAHLKRILGLGKLRLRGPESGLKGLREACSAKAEMSTRLSQSCK
jgi:Transposase DDE domain